MEFQTEAAECGLACAAMLLTHHGHQISLPELRAKFTSSRNGSSMRKIDEILRLFGMQTRGLRLEIDDLPKLQLPCIAHWKMDHFVVIEKVDRNGASILDPAIGRRRVSRCEIDSDFTGVALEASPGVSFRKKKGEVPISLAALTGPIRGKWPSLALMLILSMGMQAVLLAAPFYIQWVTDQVLPVNDKNLLLLMALAFAALAVFGAFLSMSRAWTVAYLANRISAQWIVSVFTTLLRLPMDYFSKRHLGDITSRFQSIHAIQRTLTVSFVEAVLDGGTAILTLSLMVLYSPILASISMVAVGLYLLIRRAMFMASKVGAERQMILAAKQQTYLLESIRGIQSVKSMGVESSRTSNYTNHVVSTANADFSLAKLTMWVQGAGQVIFGLERVAVVAIATPLIRAETSLKCLQVVMVLLKLSIRLSRFLWRRGGEMPPRVLWRRDACHCSGCDCYLCIICLQRSGEAPRCR